MRKLILSVIGSCVMAASAFSATNEVSSEKWAVSVGGLGWSETTQGDDNQTEYDIGVYLSLGYLFQLGLPAEAGVRQGLMFTDSDMGFATSPYVDLTLLTIKKINLDLFAGGNAMVLYGDNMSPEWMVAPEVGLRWWVKDDVAVMLRAESPFDVDGWRFADEIHYFFGFQVKL